MILKVGVEGVYCAALLLGDGDAKAALKVEDGDFKSSVAALVAANARPGTASSRRSGGPPCEEHAGAGRVDAGASSRCGATGSDGRRSVAARVPAGPARPAFCRGMMPRRKTATRVAAREGIP